jgi:hypothetical protein
MKLKNLLVIISVFSLMLSACKYDEGPGISLRTKRVRASNEWIVTDYKIDGTTDDALKSSFSYGDSLQLVFEIQKTGRYSYNLQYTKSYQEKTTWHKYFIANQTGLVSLTYDYNKNNFFKLVGSSGAWTFANRHDEIHFGPYDLSHNYTEDKPLVCKIIMLKQKMLKLEFVNADSKKHQITFEPRNDEPKFLK